MNCLLFILLLITTDLDQQIQTNMFQENVSIFSPFTNKSSHGVVHSQGYDNSASANTIYSASGLHISSSETVNSYGGGLLAMPNEPVTVKKADPNPKPTVNLFDGRLDKLPEGRYAEYCEDCYKKGVTPFPIEVWNNGQWNGHPNAFHPKSPVATGKEEEYWEEQGGGVPIGKIHCLFAYIIGYGVVRYARRKKDDCID